MILLVTAVYLAAGLVAFAGYSLTGNPKWVELFFTIPGATLTIFLTLVQVWGTRQVLGNFSNPEPMHVVWLCITGSAAFDFVGAIFSQVLSSNSLMNPLVQTPWWSPATAVLMRQYGLLLGGTCRFTLLAVGLTLSLRIYRRNGLLARLKFLDWILWIAMGVFVVRQAVDVVNAHKAGRVFPRVEIAGWPVDILLWLCLVQALLLYRSAHHMGPGWITRCWNALAVGLFLICSGVVAQWAIDWGYLPWPWAALNWYIWLPASASFALAPVYQLEAIRQAFATQN